MVLFSARRTHAVVCACVGEWRDGRMDGRRCVGGASSATLRMERRSVSPEATRSAFFSKGTAPTNVPAPTSLAIHSDSRAENEGARLWSSMHRKRCVPAPAPPLSKPCLCCVSPDSTGGVSAVFFLGAHLWPLTLAPEGTGLVWAGSEADTPREPCWRRQGGSIAFHFTLGQLWLLWLLWLLARSTDHTQTRHTSCTTVSQHRWFENPSVLRAVRPIFAGVGLCLSRAEGPLTLAGDPCTTPLRAWRPEGPHSLHDSFGEVASSLLPVVAVPVVACSNLFFLLLLL